PYWLLRDVRTSAVVVVTFFFFFQAEDGIRDPLVTGVQTCALPIWMSPSSSGRPRSNPTRMSSGSSGASSGRVTSLKTSSRGGSRSEERRVGKEWRSRGRGHH